MSDIPKFVEFHEEGVREGFQIETEIYPLDRRAKLIEALAESGLSQIQVGSFVSPKWVPSMADTPDLFAAINKRQDVSYTALWLNKKGFFNALEVPEVDLKGQLLFYATDEFSQHNNACTATEMRDRQVEWLDLYQQNDVTPSNAYLMVAFGCNFHGDVPVERITEWAVWLRDLFAERRLPLPNVYLADTVGWATPLEMRRRIAAVREVIPDARIGLHLHDTRGAGAANVLAALEMGVDLFDSSVAGLGGCPFAGHGAHKAAGNICTEDMVFMMHEMGIETGIDLDALIDAALLAEDIIGRTLNGRIMHSGSLNKYRK
jgi:hydroxymethylglutaryl-CoA lyase